MGYFKVRYDSWDVIYDCKAFIRLTKVILGKVEKMVYQRLQTA